MSVRGLAAGAMTLIALQVFSTSKGPAAAGKFVGWVNTGLKKLLSGDVALIPTSKKAPPAKTSSPAAPSTGGISLPQNPTFTTVQV